MPKHWRGCGEEQLPHHEEFGQRAASHRTDPPSSRRGKQPQDLQQMKQMSTKTFLESECPYPGGRLTQENVPEQTPRSRPGSPLPQNSPITPIPMQSCLRVLPRTNPFPSKSRWQDGGAHAKASACPMSPTGHTVATAGQGCALVCPEPPTAGSVPSAQT